MVANARWMTQSAGVGLPPIEERILDYATLGDALFQEQVQQAIAMCQNRMVGAIAMLRFVPWSGDAYHVNRQTPVESARWVDDTDNTTSTDFTGADEADYAKVSFAVKFMLVIARISRHAQVRGRDYVDMLSLETAHAVEALLYNLELTTFQGNEGSDPKEFDGLFELLQAYNGSVGGRPVQIILPANATLSATPGSSTMGDLTLELLDEGIDLLKPGQHVIFTSRAGRRVIRSLLQSLQNFETGVRVQGGFEVETYFGAPIMPTDGITKTINFIEDGSGNPEVSAHTGSNGTAVIMVNTDEVFYAQWTQATVEPIESGTSQVDRIDGYWDGTLVLECPQGASGIWAIKPTA